MPTASNGSMAAIAPDPSAALRTLRALRDERFDVVNLHEPLAPGPTLPTLIFGGGPLVGPFHRAGESGWVRAFRPLGVWASKPFDGPGRRVGGGPRHRGPGARWYLRAGVDRNRRPALPQLGSGAGHGTDHHVSRPP